MRQNMGKIAVILVGLGIVAAFFAFDLKQYLTLDALKQNKEMIQTYYTDHQALTISIYFIAYVLMAALSLPGATILTLAGGAFFGLWTGLILVSFSSTVGATCAFLVARYLLKDSVQDKFGDKLRAINEGVSKEGAFYLFTLRLIPAFPFFVINLVMGLTPIRAMTFYWVSQLGMLPGTFVYVNAGTQLAQIDSLAGILSPKLIGSFILLGLFPLLAKKAMGLLAKKKRQQDEPIIKARKNNAA